MSLRAHLGSSQLVFYLNILMLANSSTYFGLCTPVTVSPFMFTSLRLTWEDLMSIYIILKCGLCMTTVMCNTYIPFQFEIKTTASALTCLWLFSFCGWECISFLSRNCLLQFVHNLNKCLDLLNTRTWTCILPQYTWTCILRKRMRSQVAIKKLAYWTLLVCLLHWMLGYWYMVNAHVCNRYGIDIQPQIPWMVLCGEPRNI